MYTKSYARAWSFSFKSVQFTSGPYGKKCNNDYNNRHHHHNSADDDGNIIDCNLYSSKGALHYWKLKHDKNDKETKMYALLAAS